MSFSDTNISEKKKMDFDSLVSAVESVLFSSAHPLKVTKIFNVLAIANITREDIQKALDTLMEYYKTNPQRGVVLTKVNGGYQFRTKPENKPFITRLEGVRELKLSKAAMEVLAIIAYNQPTTKAFINEVRAMDSSHIIRQLLDKGFIKIIGKDKNHPGNPLLYGTTDFFLEYFSLNSLEDLPTIKDLQEIDFIGENTDVYDIVKKEILNNDILKFEDKDNLLGVYDKFFDNLKKVLYKTKKKLESYNEKNAEKTNTEKQREESTFDN